VIVDEFKEEYNELRKNQDFISYDNVVWDNPLLDDAACLKIWDRLVGLAVVSKTVGGKMYIG
jgi:hypothetical protein